MATGDNASPQPRWWMVPPLWIEAFAFVNLSFLALDIYVAHSTNRFLRPTEYIPLWFSLISPAPLLVAIIAWLRSGRSLAWKRLGYVVGYGSVVVGIGGVVLHLDSHFFYERTIRSLTYAAPFAAPLAYAGIGLLLIMNRMVEWPSQEWAQWVVFLALGGFAGNFVLSLTDHAANGFFRPIEWLPVITSAFAVSALLVPLVMAVEQSYLLVCALVLLLQMVVGVWGFVLHAEANMAGPSIHAWENFVYGAPPFAPLLLPNLVILAAAGLWSLRPYLTTAKNRNRPAVARDRR